VTVNDRPQRARTVITDRSTKTATMSTGHDETP
jgi:hypothetical protein